MNVRQIEIFKAIMEYGSVTEAARQMHITQPSVSKHLKLLEEEIGIELFTRTGNRLISTPEGQALFDQIERVYTGLDNLRGFADDLKHNRHGEITIASMPLLAQFWLPEKIAPFIKEHAGVSISLPVRSSRWIATTVAARRADFGLSLKPIEKIPGILTQSLLSLPLVCVMYPDHRLAGHRKIEAAELENEEVITLKNFDRIKLALEGELEDRKFKPQRYIHTFSSQMACELAKIGVGIALVDILSASKYLGSDMIVRPLEPEVLFEFCVIIPEHWPLSRLSKWLISHLIEQANATKTEMSALMST